MDEDGIVEEVVDGAFEVDQQSSSIFNLFGNGITLIQSYGWFIVLFAILIYYVKRKLDQRPGGLFGSGSGQAAAKVSEEEALDRMERMERARRRQEESLQAAKQKYLEEKRIKEEIAARERAEEWDRHKQGLGYKNRSKPTDENDELAKLGLSSNNAAKKKPRQHRDDDYNPLMGSAPSCSFRSSRGGPRSGGG